MRVILNRVLLIGAVSPDNPLNFVPKELRELKKLFEQNGVKVEFEPYLTKDILSESLSDMRNSIDIFHFSGHSDAETLETNDGGVYTDKISSIIKTWSKKPYLFFLNGCNNSAQVSQLMDCGVSVVIATNNSISDKKASQFSFLFYSEILKESNIHDAYTRAGNTVYLDNSENYRTINIPSNVSTTTKWDWGLFSKNPSQLSHTKFSKKLSTTKIYIIISLIILMFFTIFIYLKNKEQKKSKPITVEILPHKGVAFFNDPLSRMINTHNESCIQEINNNSFFSRTNCKIIRIENESILESKLCTTEKLSYTSLEPIDIVKKIVDFSECMIITETSDEYNLLSIESKLTYKDDMFFCNCK